MAGDYRSDARRIIGAMLLCPGAAYLNAVKCAVPIDAADFDFAILWMVDAGYIWRANGPQGVVAYLTDKAREWVPSREPIADAPRRRRAAR